MTREKQRKGYRETHEFVPRIRKMKLSEVVNLGT